MRSKIISILITAIVITLISLSFKLGVLFPLTVKQEASIPKGSVKKYVILIDIEACKLYLIENGSCQKQYLIAAGKHKTPTPIGYFKIVHKSTWGEGFGGRWMGLNVPWGKYGIHGTIFPNSIGGHTSHGCIRMWNKDVKELYKIVPIGTRVMIINGPYGAFGQGFRTLSLGSTGVDVEAVQKRLKELGFYKYNADGRFGPALQDALYKFQKSRNMPKRNKISTAEYEAMGIVLFE